MRSKAFKYENVTYTIAADDYSSCLSISIYRNRLYYWLHIPYDSWFIGGEEDIDKMVMECHAKAKHEIDRFLRPARRKARLKKAINSDTLKGVQEIIQ